MRTDWVSRCHCFLEFGGYEGLSFLKVLERPLGAAACKSEPICSFIKPNPTNFPAPFLPVSLPLINKHSFGLDLARP